MLGVIIVDDEALSRMELKTMIDWEKEGFLLLGEAENGQAGLEIILRDKPDIVITDIKMPVMDGLEMIEQALKEYDGARYIVLSSYEDFSLLKTAMQYGVFDYLLKLELSCDILLRALSRTKSALLRERDEARSREISPASQAARTLRRALTAQSSDEDITEILSLANPAIDPSRLSCVAVRFSLPRKNQSFGDEDLRTMEMAAHSIVNDIVKQYNAGVSFLADIGLCLFIYTPNSNGIDNIIEMSGVIINMLRQYLNMSSAVGVSESCCISDNVSVVMDEAIRATEEAFFLGYGKVICFAECEKSAVTHHLTVDWSALFLRALELRQRNDLNEAFDIMQEQLSGNSRPEKTEAFGLCFSVAGLALSALKKNPDSKGLFSENLYDIIGESETLEELREWLNSFRSSLLELLDSLPPKNGDDYIVMAAKRYITENSRNTINLNTVAKHLSISSGYLSSVFKRKAKVGFVEYVTRVKMAEAKNLLLSGKYKIYEVSALIGYEDTSYFIKIFHKITGVTPKEYIAKLGE